MTRAQGMNYEGFFKRAYGRESEPEFGPYSYQCRSAEELWPCLLDMPMGLGKTLAWLWKRGWREGVRDKDVDCESPRRLVYCLPMRVLVEQTAADIDGWLRALDLYGNPGDGKVRVTVLMGGANEIKTWAEHPEEDMILVRTQDM
ncbi:MAG: hypothetical protein ACREQV_05030, partial [Candidatus Binatia bacterium]